MVMQITLQGQTKPASPGQQGPLVKGKLADGTYQGGQKLYDEKAYRPNWMADMQAAPAAAVAAAPARY